MNMETKLQTLRTENKLKQKQAADKITPPMLTSCFFPYTQESILNLLNHEICCDFNHMIVTNGIDLDSSTAPLCGTI